MENAATLLLEQISINPVIAAVCNEEELSLALESEYGIEIDEELDGKMTIGELVEMIEELQEI